MKVFGTLVISIGFVASVSAQDLGRQESTDDLQQNFQRGQREGSLGAGISFSPFIAIRNRPVVNYAGVTAQLGYLLNDLNGSSWWRGNFEPLGEVFGSGIFLGRGNYLADGRFWMRYNFVQREWKVVPYVQAGVGVTFTDADQSVFGQVFNFNQAAAIGVRYFIRSHCSLNGEYRVQHISNASMSDKNLGINAQGGVLSVSWFF